MMKNHEGKISVLEKIGFGFGDTASNIVFQSVMMFMSIFYTDIFGLTPAAMGTMFLMVRIIDAITDPMMGALADRTNTKWGKFRPYLLWLSVPFAIMAVVTFTTPDFGPTGKLVYAYITYSVLMIVYTAINIPYCALGGVITPDSEERVSLNSYRFFLASAGGVLVAIGTPKLSEWLGGGSQQKGFQMAMVVLGSFAVLMFIASFLMTRERVTQVSDDQGTLKRDLKYLLRNEQWVIIAILNFILLIPLVIRGSVATYYMKWYAGREDLWSYFLTTGMISAMIGALFSPLFTKHFSKVKSYIIIQSTIVVLSVGLYFIGSTQIALMFVVFAVVQFFTQMGSPILWTMMADTVDYGEWKTGRRTTGLGFSGILFSLKMGMALGGAILGWLLAFYGYEGTAVTQTPGALNGIVFLFSVIPAIGHLLLILIVPFYKLDNKRCAQIRNELDQRQ